MVVCLERGAELHIAQLMPLPLSKIQTCFTSLVPAHPGSPGQRAVKHVCVCVCSLVQQYTWVKKCMEYDVEGPRPRGRPKRTWREVVREDCQARKMNKEDAMDRCKWRKVINDV